MSKKQIGIPGWMGSNMFGITRNYAEFISRFGNVVVLSPNDDIREDLDMLVLPGGKDVNPARYADEISFYTGDPNPHLEFFDEKKLPGYLEMNIGILSICRASQSLWAMYGGKLNQHIYNHKQSMDQDHQCHHLHWNSEKLAKTYGKLLDTVNSRHHQSMDGTQGAPDGLEILAFSKEKHKEWEEIRPDIVEIFRSTDRKIFGYQGHPEDMRYDGLTPMIMKELLEFKNKKVEQIV